MALLTLPDPGLLSSIGNVVTIGVQLYRSHFRAFLKLAFVAHLWLLLPIYGWAKSYSIAALMARLAFNHLTDETKPDEVLQATFNQKKWRILTLNAVIAIRLALFLLLVYLLVAVFIVFVGEIFSIEPIQKLRTLPTNSPPAVMLGGVVLSVMAFSGIWFYARYFIVELPFSMECDFRVNSSLKRSRQLTQRSIIPVLVVWFTVFLLSFIPSYVFANLVGIRLIWMPTHWLLRMLQFDISIRWLVFYIIWGIFCLSASAITMPLWQTTKAVMYYSLRSRWEGFDLDLRSRVFGDSSLLEKQPEQHD